MFEAIAYINMKKHHLKRCCFCFFFFVSTCPDTGVHFYSMDALADSAVELKKFHVNAANYKHNLTDKKTIGPQLTNINVLC